MESPADRRQRHLLAILHPRAATVAAAATAHELAARRHALQQQLDAVDLQLERLREREHVPAASPAPHLAALTVGGDASAAKVAAILRAHGACIVERLVPAAHMAALLPTLRHCKPGGPFGGVACVVEAPLVRPLLEHPLVLAAARAVLAPSRNLAIKIVDTYEIPPGKEERQLLHREDGLFPFAHRPWEWNVDAMWALQVMKSLRHLTSPHRTPHHLIVWALPG